MANTLGKLIICPTPIGNLGDMTERTVSALGEADVVCAEDTRVTGKLLAAFGIEKRLERLDEALIGDRAAQVAERVLAGEVIAYCSDAGMPGVSDPGLRLVRAARKAGAPVEGWQLPQRLVMLRYASLPAFTPMIGSHAATSAGTHALTVSRHAATSSGVAWAAHAMGVCAACAM